MSRPAAAKGFCINGTVLLSSPPYRCSCAIGSRQLRSSFPKDTELVSTQGAIKCRVSSQKTLTLHPFPSCERDDREGSWSCRSSSHIRNGLSCGAKPLAGGVVSDLPQRPSLAADHLSPRLLLAATHMSRHDVHAKPQIPPARSPLASLLGSSISTGSASDR